MSAATAAPAIGAIGLGSSAPFPMFDRVWEIFTEKGIRTIFVSIGNSSSSAADLDLAETIGCPMHVIPLTEKGRAEWAEIAAILKEKKREGANATHSFSEGAEQKWILPKNIRVQEAVPSWEAGTIRRTLHVLEGKPCAPSESARREGAEISTIPVKLFVDTICREAKLKDDITRIDILKIDAKSEWPGLEKNILAAVLDAGYRPCIVLVNWSEAPDVDLSTTLAAGHLQNSGYRLYGKEGTKFLYYFSDNDLYQLCSWEDTKAANPLVNELARQLLVAGPFASGSADAATSKEVPASDQKEADNASA